MRLVVYCLSAVYQSVSQLSTKSTKFGSWYLVDRLPEWGKILHIDRALSYISSKIGELWPRGPPGAPKFTSGYKFFVTFLVHHLPKRNEIWHDDGHCSVVGLKRFWWTLVHFPLPMGIKTFRKQIPGTLFAGAWWNLAALRVGHSTLIPWIRWTLVGRSHNTMRRHGIIPSLIHLFLLSPNVVIHLYSYQQTRIITSNRLPSEQQSVGNHCFLLVIK